jgi:hypothetical protein
VEDKSIAAQFYGERAVAVHRSLSRVLLEVREIDSAFPAKDDRTDLP